MMLMLKLKLSEIRFNTHHSLQLQVKTIRNNKSLISSLLFFLFWLNSHLCFCSNFLSKNPTAWRFSLSFVKIIEVRMWTKRIIVWQERRRRSKEMVLRQRMMSWEGYRCLVEDDGLVVGISQVVGNQEPLAISRVREQWSSHGWRDDSPVVVDKSILNN